MRSIAIMNQKGGVGKTTTSVNLAVGLARHGCRVQLLDLDPQAHASLHLGLEPQEDFTSIYDVLVEGKSLADVRRQMEDNLWLVPAHLDLTGVELKLASVIGREIVLRNKIAADSEAFDFLIIDCPPSLGLLTLNALSAVEDIIVPLQPHYLAMHGLSKLLETIDIVADLLNSRLRLDGVVLCMYDGATTLAREVADDVSQFFQQKHEANSPWATAKMFQTKIRRNVRLAEAPSFGKSIFDYDPQSHGAQDYAALVEEVLNRK
ncbi:MAG: AAA family ATPase [Planctomycetia bacterium]|nr:AAA family ATPase [Planctomycetia bacterium]